MCMYKHNFFKKNRLEINTESVNYIKKSQGIFPIKPRTVVI